MDYGTIGGLVVLVAIIAIAVLVIVRKSGNKKLAEDFLKGISTEILNTALDCIEKKDPRSYDTLIDFENAIIDDIYNNTWDYVKEKVNTEYDAGNLAKAILNIVDKKQVVAFIDALIDNKDISEKIKAKYLEYKIEAGEDITEDDKLAEEYSDQEQYVETSNDADLEKAVDKEPTEEEKAAINPQHDEEEDYNVEDDSMEVITDKPIIVTSTDKNGNTLYYQVDADGRKTRVSKAFALENM